jgi:hypothetical protein
MCAFYFASGRRQAEHMSINDLFTAAGIMGGIISALFGGGYLLSRARRERDWGEAIGTLREQVADLASDLADLRHDFDALRWAVLQEPYITQSRIFSRARTRALAYRNKADRERELDGGEQEGNKNA